jgi:hypothetical protein
VTTSNHISLLEHELNPMAFLSHFLTRKDSVNHLALARSLFLAINLSKTFKEQIAPKLSISLQVGQSLNLETRSETCKEKREPNLSERSTKMFSQTNRQFKI